MLNKEESLKSKLALLGMKIEYEDTMFIVSSNPVNKMKTLYIIGNNIVKSEEFNRIQHIGGTVYSIVSKNKNLTVKHGLMKNIQDFEDLTHYSYLRNPIVQGKDCRIIAGLSKTTLGLIDADENIIISLSNSNISAYQVCGDIIYVCEGTYGNEVYDFNGNILPVSRLIQSSSIICKDYIIIKGQTTIFGLAHYIICDLQGKKLEDFPYAKLKQINKKWCLIGEDNNLLLDNIELANKIENK